MKINTLQPDLTKVALSLYDYLATPRALTATIMVRYGEWDQLASLRVDPACYLDTVSAAAKFARDYQASDFLRKSPLLPITRSRKAEAEKVFDECEEQCFSTNIYLQNLLVRSVRGVLDSPLERRLVEILDGARKITGRILGRLPPDLLGNFGPGTSYELKESPYTTVLDKIYTQPCATSACKPLFEWLYWRTHWGLSRLRECLPLPGLARGNRFTTVKKDATKDRGICIENLGNLWVQLAVGSVLKRKLADIGLHVGKQHLPACPVERLRVSQPFDGQHHHRNMAREGSRQGGRWATIDLSNASDTIAKMLVKWVFPVDWHDLLSACRSPYTLINNTWVRLEKFSSMGNGSTFEMETLVFAAIISAATDLKIGEDLFVYGDDIVLPNEQFNEAMAVLRACGFTPNKAKSFATGSFRESCGGDYYEGFSVRPVVADTSFTAPTDWFKLHNQLKHRWPRAFRVSRIIVEQVPNQLRLYGPGYLGDRVLHSARKLWRPWNKDGITYVAVVTPILPSVPLARWSPELHMTGILAGGVTGGKRTVVPVRGDPLGYRTDKASVS